MAHSSRVAPRDVHASLARHLIADTYPMVLDMEFSAPSRLRDLLTGHEYLDFYSFFASNPVGFNHPRMREVDIQERLARVATTRVTNSDCYTTYLADFVDTLSRLAAPPELVHYFFIDGGSLAVENAMKTAFDWKVRKNRARGKGDLGTRVLHFQNAFHGRSGYALSVTNTDPLKTDLFPKFDWPRISCPKITFPLQGENLDAVGRAEAATLAEAEAAFDRFPDDIAAILIEPIQGEGGDNHFRPELFRHLRRLADEREAMLIYDEVQTGVGLTGRYWAYQHHGVTPDILCFAKKMQVGGIMVSRRVEEVADNVFAKASRINSTWGGSLVDMVRATQIMEIIESAGLVENAAARGGELLSGLRGIQERFPDVVSNARGAGLMCAIDLSSTELRDAVVRRCFENRVIVLPAGRRAIRFRPTLVVPTEAIGEGLELLSRSVAQVLG